MTKKVKRLILILLSAGLFVCLVFCCMLPTISNTVYADSYTTEELGDGNFRFEEGASLQFANEEGGEIETLLGFRLFLDNPEFENLKNFAPNRHNLDKMLNVYKHTFTVYRCNGDGSTSTPLMRFLIAFDTKEKGLNDVVLRRWVAYKNLSYYDEKINFITPQEKGSNVDDRYKKADMYDYLSENGYTLCGEPDILDSSKASFPNVVGLNWGNGVEKAIRLAIDAYSPYTSYYVKFEYEYQYCTKVGMQIWNNIEYGTLKGSVDSSVRSVYSVLKNMDEQDGIETVLGEWMEYDSEIVTYARDIVDNMTKKEITVNYLERIGKTPFATKKEATITVPIVNDRVNLDDVYAALGIDTLNCLDSNCNEIRLNVNTGEYEAYYYKNVWLRSITTDGNYVDYFLDINQSFEDYYHPFVRDGVFSEELYEWLFSTQLLTKYPDLQGYGFDEIYGYFGFVTIPQTLSIDNLWVEMFNIETSQTGIIRTFKFEENLSYDAYQKLLTDYKYGWLEKAWNGVAGFVSGSKYLANYYMFFSEPGTNDAFIGEGGQEDALEPDGALGETFDKVVDETKDKLGDVLDIGDNFWDILTSPFKKKNTTIAIISIVAVAAVVIVIIKYRGKGAKKRKK